MEQIINSKTYPMWSQFVERKNEWVGGKMFEVDSVMGATPMTEIVNIELVPNGPESAMICIRGIDYDCCADVQYCGIGGTDQLQPGFLAIFTQFGSTYYIQQRQSH